MTEHEQPSVVARLRESIDTVLVPRGFAAGQVGTAEGQCQIVWCAAADDFAVRFPGLPASREPLAGWGGMCTDICVDVVRTGGEWRVTDVDLEGAHLDQLLAGIGLDAAARRATALIGSTAHDCLASLPPLLIELLDGSASQH